MSVVIRSSSKRSQAGTPKIHVASTAEKILTVNVVSQVWHVIVSCINSFVFVGIPIVLLQHGQRLSFIHMVTLQKNERTALAVRYYSYRIIDLAPSYKAPPAMACEANLTVLYERYAHTAPTPTQ